MTEERRQLIKYLRHLTAREYPLYPHETMLPDEADRLLHEAHSFAFRKICLLAEKDVECEQFRSSVYASITRPYGGLYDSADVVRAACNLAARTLKRLQTEETKKQAESLRDPVGFAHRRYIEERAAFDPFMEGDANVQVSGLPEIPKTQIRINPLDGHVEDW